MKSTTLEEAARKVIEKNVADENFKNWFGKSILKHEDGAPMTFYHGTNSDFHTYDYAHVGKGTDAYGSGFYFTNKPEIANMYSTMNSTEGSNVHKVHLKVEKPIYPEDEKPFKRDHIQKLIMAAPNHEESLMNYGDVSYHGYRRVLNDATDTYTDLGKMSALHALSNDFYSGHEGTFLENLKKITKHDAVIVKNHDTGHVIVNVFHPTQIKSAIGNTGEFSKKKQNITESTLSVKDEVDSFRHKWNEKGVQNFVYAHPGVISLSQIVVPKAVRSKGIGSAFMQELTDIADKHNHRVVLSPSSDFGGTKSRLISFYKKHGFVENKGKNKDYTVSETMIRDPKGINESVSEEDWLHVRHRKNITPLEHVKDIVNEHTKLGWKFSDEERQLTHPLSTNLSGGVYRSIRMHNPEGKSSVINVKFRYGNDRKQNEYKVKRTILG